MLPVESGMLQEPPLVRQVKRPPQAADFLKLYYRW